MNRTVLFHRSLLLLLFLFLVLFPLTRPVDPDVWYHLAVGRHLWTGGEYPQMGSFLYTYPPAAPPVHHAWLFQGGLFSLYRLGGMPGLVVVKSLLLACAFGWLFLRSLTRRTFYLSLGYLLIAFAAGSGRFLLRPEVAGAVILAAMWVVLSRPLTRSRGLLLLALQILWVNMHWSAILGLGVTAAYTAAHWSARMFPLPQGWTTGSERNRSGGYLLLLGGMLLATLVNPDFHRPLLEPFRFFFPRDFLLPVPEVWPTYKAFLQEGRPAFLQWYFLALGLGALSFAVNWRRLNLAHLYAGLGLGLVSLSAERHILFFSLLAVPLVGANLRVLVKDRPPRSGSWRETVCALAAAVVLVNLLLNKFSGMAFLVPYPTPYEPLSVDASPVLWPHRAARFLVEAGLPDRIFNNFNSGNYLSWAASPRRMYINGTLTDPRTEEEYWRLRLHPEQWPAFAGRHGVSTVFFRLVPVIAPPEVLEAILRHPDWKVVFYDGTAVALVHDTPEHRWLVDKYEVDLQTELDGARKALASPEHSSVSGRLRAVWREAADYRWRLDQARLFRSRAEFYLLAGRPDLARFSAEVARRLTGEPAGGGG